MHPLYTCATPTTHQVDTPISKQMRHHSPGGQTRWTNPCLYVFTRAGGHTIYLHTYTGVTPSSHQVDAPIRTHVPSNEAGGDDNDGEADRVRPAQSDPGAEEGLPAAGAHRAVVGQRAEADALRAEREWGIFDQRVGPQARELCEQVLSLILITHWLVSLSHTSNDTGLERALYERYTHSLSHALALTWSGSGESFGPALQSFFYNCFTPARFTLVYLQLLFTPELTPTTVVTKIMAED